MNFLANVVFYCFFFPLLEIENYLLENYGNRKKSPILRKYNF